MPHVTREVTLPAEPDEVWNALTSEELLEQWLAEHRASHGS